jgi:hypothetical protein
MPEAELPHSDAVATIRATDPPYIPTWFEYRWYRGGNVGSPIVGFTFLLLSVLFWRSTGSRFFLFPLVPIAIGMAIIPITHRLAFKVLLSWEDQVVRFMRIRDAESQDDRRVWYRLHFTQGATSHIVLYCALGFSGICALMFSLLGDFSAVGFLSTFFALFEVALAGFFCGAVLGSMGLLFKLIWEIGHQEIIVSAHSFGVTSTGSTLLKVYAMGAGVWSVFLLSAYNFRHPWVLIFSLAVPTFIFLCGSFVLIQFPLHARMNDYKKRELARLDSVLSQLIPQDLAHCTPVQRERIPFYQKLQKDIDDLPEWPFRWRSYLGVIGASVAAAVPTILSYLLQSGILHLAWVVAVPTR